MQLASEAITIFATGKPEPKRDNLSIANLGKYGQSSPDWMKQALDGAAKTSKTPEWSHLDLKRVAAGGQSCCSMETAVMTMDSRVPTIGIVNSGNFDFGTYQGLYEAFSKYMTPGWKVALKAS